MTNFVKKFTSDESGATAIEYGMIAALIALGIISSASLIGNDLSNGFGAAGDGLSNADVNKDGPYSG